MFENGFNLTLQQDFLDLAFVKDSTEYKGKKINYCVGGSEKHWAVETFINSMSSRLDNIYQEMK